MIYKKIHILGAVESGISEDVAKEYIDHRVDKKSPIRQRGFDRYVKKVIGMSLMFRVEPDLIIEESIDRGWLSNEPHWSKYGKDTSRTGSRSTTLAEDITDRSWAAPIMDCGENNKLN